MLRRLLDIVGQGKTSEATPAPPRAFVEIPADVEAIYAVPDIHGCIDELLRAERRIADDARRHAAGRALVVALGDYVDRGPSSAEVLDRCLAGALGGLPTVFLCGNHDAAMLAFLEDPEPGAEWLAYGGDATLLSYGVEVARHLRAGGLPALREAARAAVPPAHVEFLRTLPILARQFGLVFVHAGLRPNVPVEAQTDEDMLWIREPFLDEGPGPAYVVVHGHTIFPAIDFGINRIGVDTGCYAHGHLGVLRLAGGKAREI